MTARWAVGCDGASSAVRELAGFEMDDLGFRQRWLVVDLHGVAAPPGSRVLQVCDPDRPATSVPVGGGRHRFEIRVGDDERIADPAARAMELVEPCVDVLGLDPAGVERAAVYEFRGRLARTFRRGRILLAGDAAHQMPPFLGQGLCTGIRDVANLAWKLAYVVDGRATPDLLDTYTEERRPHARRAIRLSATVGRIVSDRQPVRAAVRNRLLAFGERILPTGSLGAIGVPPLPSGPLVDRGGVPHPGTGVWGRVGTFARGLGSDVGRPFDSDVPLREGSFAILGASGAVAAGLPPALRRWWERLGAACLEEDPATVPPATPPQIAVVRPDGFLLGRYPLPSQGGPSPLCDVAVRLSAAGIRAPG